MIDLVMLFYAYKFPYVLVGIGIYRIVAVVCHSSYINISVLCTRIPSCIILIFQFRSSTFIRRGCLFTENVIYVSTFRQYPAAKYLRYFTYIKVNRAAC